MLPTAVCEETVYWFCNGVRMLAEISSAGMISFKVAVTVNKGAER